MKDFQHEQLFTELTPAEAAVIDGGAKLFDSTAKFDQALDSRVFNSPAGDIKLNLTKVRESGNGRFNVGLVQVFPFQDRPKGRREVRPVAGLGDEAIWRNQPAGNYKLLFRDERDNKFVDVDFQVDIA